MEKIYRVQMNSNGMPNFATAVEVDTDISDYSDKLWRNAYERGKADRPQGEWIEEEYKGRIYGIYRCQYKCFHCGYVPMHRGEPIIPTNRTLRFCPNCGARMRPKLQGKHFDSIIIDESAMKGADDDN